LEAFSWRIGRFPPQSPWFDEDNCISSLGRKPVLYIKIGQGLSLGFEDRIYVAAHLGRQAEGAAHKGHRTSRKDDSQLLLVYSIFQFAKPLANWPTNADIGRQFFHDYCFAANCLLVHPRLGTSRGPGVVPYSAWCAYRAARTWLASYSGWKNDAYLCADRVGKDVGRVPGLYRPTGT
jgi:hypothetical protein